MADADEVVDFGAGRGWFLEACREAGMHNLVGIDTSEKSLGCIREKGFEAIEILGSIDLGWKPPFDKLYFKPRVLVFLDVLEHFHPEYAISLLSSLIREAGSQLELVVVKVPNCSGIVYRVAVALSRIGVAGPLDQLYQAGTYPPHFSYFSDRSLTIFLERCGFTPSEKKGDRDFEVTSFGDRIQSFKIIPYLILKLVGASLALAGYLTGWHDSLIVVARKKRMGGS
jgi:hypothetical protein